MNKKFYTYQEIAKAYNVCLKENKRKPELEPIILTNIDYSYLYALNIIKGRWLEAEPMFLIDSFLCYYYAKEVIKGRWIKAEPIIKLHEGLWNDYYKYFNIKPEKINWKVGL